MRAFVAAVMLLSLAGCGTMGADTQQPARKPVAGKVALPPAPPPPPFTDDRRVCTADVKLCPDGSAVSRNADNGCAFNACPGETKQ